MARFRGTVAGGRGEASRLGHATTGLRTIAKGWGGKIVVSLIVHARGTVREQDWAEVTHVDKEGVHKTLYFGPLDEYRDPRGVKLPLYQEQPIVK